ncbi:MAG TPA: phage baseplate assembly protein V [Allosphingosinicella sp.]|jgi:hypothetical protein
MSSTARIHTAPARQFVGKYRGKVIDNLDELFQGRIKAFVPAVPGSLENWALPCTPYAGRNVGFYAIPPIGANVWIEFEGGDPNYPIWAGCFWGPLDILHVPEPPLPEVKVFKTENITMVLNDLPEIGGFSLKCMPTAVAIPLTMTFDSTGITILCPESTIKMTPGSITLSIPEAELNMVPANITATVPESLISIAPAAITMTVPESVVSMTGESIEIACPTSSISLVPEAMAITADALAVVAEANITGAIAVEGAIDVVGAVAIEGAVDIVGGLAIEGGGTIDGAPIL